MGSATAAIFTAPGVFNPNIAAAGITTTDNGSYYPVGVSVGFDFKINCVGGSGVVKLKLQGSTASCVRIYVDDVLQSNPTISTVAIADTDMLTGIAAGDKKFSIRFVATAYIGSINNGSSPQITVTATGTPTIGLPTGWTTPINFPTSSIPTNVDIGAGNIVGTQGDGTLGIISSYNDADVRVNANGTALWIWTLQEGCTYGTVYEKDSLLPTTVGTGGTWGWVQVGALNAAAVSANGVPTGDWSVFGVNVATATTGVARIGALMITGGTGITATAITAKTKYAVIGDSTMAKIKGDYADSTITSISRLLAKLLDVMCTNAAVAGHSIHTDLAVDITALLATTVKPTHIIQRTGINDVLNSFAIGDASSGDTKILNDAVTTVLAGITGTYWMMLITSSTHQTPAAIAPYNTMLSGAVVTAASSRVKQMDTRSATTNTDLAADGYHDTDAADIKQAVAIANQLIPGTVTSGTMIVRPSLGLGL